MKQEIFFENLSYKGQVKVLTKMAREVLSSYPLKSPKLEFIHHGENATFRVRDSKANNYLLRLHRPVYHSRSAILEELQWLQQLRGKVRCQKPVADLRGEYVGEVRSDVLQHSRLCDLLSWEKGSIRHEKHSVNSFYQLGLLTAQLHDVSPKASHYRNYWTADGLLGADATFGSPMKMKGHLKNYHIYNECREMVFNQLLSWQQSRKNRQGVIHADLHFGNMVWDGEGVIPIDFDDCGFGFFMYDLAVTFLASEEMVSEKGAEDKLLSYLMGYQTKRNLDSKDIEMIPWLMLARKLGMLSWLYHRQDNPRFIPIFKKWSNRDFPLFKESLKHGPRFDWLPI
jgi:Ser/Thr protein kinase RdoA (MazF antagonist)